MAEHPIESCPFPFWKWRYRDRLWICSICNQAWITRKRYGYNGSFRNWEKWTDGS